MASPEPVTVRTTGVKKARRLARRRFREQTGEFLAEGPQAVREALAGGYAIEVFATQGAQTRWNRALDARGSTPWHIVDPAVVESLSDTVHTQGVVARCRQLDRSLTATLHEARLVAICVDIGDPGNLGTVVRSSDAAGADALIVAGDSVDLYNPKTVRASAGSLFHLPVAVERDLALVVGAVREAGLRLVGATAGAEVDIFDAAARLAEPTAWVFGNEAHGLPEAAHAALDAAVSVPIYGRAESLNLATAAALCLYASVRALRDDA